MCCKLSMTGALIGAFLLAITGCSPKYPNCEKDEHCKEKEFCVNGLCQQCKDNKDCPKGEVCNAGRCELAKNYCQTSADCKDGAVCKNNQCVPCTKDAECGSGKCQNGRCVQCVTDKDCPQNHECQNGRCVAPPDDLAAGKCVPETVFFDFDEYVLTSGATQALQRVATCLKTDAARPVRVEGHCDPRGTDEYNIALGDRRAQSVKRYLGRLGVEEKRLRGVSKGKLEATGIDENGWSKDRKVVFIWE